MQHLKRLTVPIVMAIVLASSISQPSLAGRLGVQPESKLWLEGTSTVHDYKSTASALEVKFEENTSLWPADASGAAAIEGLIRAKGITAMDVAVGVTGLHSGKSGLDKNMYKALLAPKHPDIRFKMTSYEVKEGAKPAEIALDAKGTLSIAGVEREIVLPVTAVREGETLRMKGSTPLLMSEYGIKPPTMMMGTIKTKDRVVVSFDLIVAQNDSTHAGSVE